MKKATMAARYLMGLVFFVFGLNGFLHFLPLPTDMPPEAMAYMQVMMSSGLMYVVKVMEVVCGAMLLANFYPVLAVALLSPIVFNIFFMHATTHREGLPVAIVLVLCTGYLVFFGYRKAFSALLSKKV